MPDISDLHGHRANDPLGGNLLFCMPGAVNQLGRRADDSLGGKSCVPGPGIYACYLHVLNKKGNRHTLPLLRQYGTYGASVLLDLEGRCTFLS